MPKPERSGLDDAVLTDVVIEGMRAHVAESWHRSAAAGVHPDDQTAPLVREGADLREFREAHPLAQVFPLLDEVLGQAARDCDAVMAVADASAQLLWVCGLPQVLRQAESIGFVEGSLWDERVAGTNAPGMAVALRQSVNVIGQEHFRRSVRRWSCAAAPIFDPVDGGLLGIVDVTGGDQIVVPQTMAMVRAAARMAETELAHQRLSASLRVATEHTGPSLRLQVMGRHEMLLEIDDARGRRHTVRLSPRHSEIVVLLAAAPRGLSGDELGVLLYEEDASASTMRAEVNRLRHLLGDDLLASRPYRLSGQVSGDWWSVEARLVAGDLTGAVRAYRGPVLPRSTAPGVVRLREEIEAKLRMAVLRSGEPDLMSAWTRSPWGADDYEMWVAQRTSLGATSPLMPLVLAQIDRLDREFG